MLACIDDPPRQRSAWDDFGDDEDAPGGAAVAEPEEETVWVRIAPGKLKLVPRRVAEAEGLEVDARPGVGFIGGGHGGVRREFMTAAEREELFRKTGRRVEDRADMRATFRETGLREAERGEDAYERFDAVASGERLDTRHRVEGMDLYGDDRRRPQFSMREAYLRNCQKYGKRPDPATVEGLSS